MCYQILHVCANYQIDLAAYAAARHQCICMGLGMYSANSAKLRVHNIVRGSLQRGRAPLYFYSIFLLRCGKGNLVVNSEGECPTAKTLGKVDIQFTSWLRGIVARH